MPFIVPSFEGGLDGLVVCGLYCDDSPTKLGWLTEDTFRITARQKTPSGTLGVWVSIERGKDGQHGHFHVDIGPEPAFKWIEKQLDYKRAKWTEVNRVFERLAGLHVESRATIEFTVSKKRLPRRGIVTSLMGLQTESCGREMAVTSVEFQIVDDMFTRAKIQDRETECDVQLKFKDTAEVSDNYLQHFAQLGREGLDSFILEKPRVPPDVDSMRKRTPRIRRA